MNDALEDAAKLGREILSLKKLPPAHRAARARALSDEAKTVLSIAGDAAVVEALRSATYAEVAAAMGVSTSAVNKAVTRHGARTRVELPQGVDTVLP